MPRKFRTLATSTLIAATMLAPMAPAHAAAMVSEPQQGAKPAVHAKSAMASSNHPLVTQAMVEVMRNGGNALDAALTGLIMQHVVEPQMSTLAGAMSLMYYEAKTGKYYYLDAELDHTMKGAPVSAGWVSYTGGGKSVEETSGRLIAVPGTVAGLKAAADRFGTLKWGDYFKPAIAVAETGFPMYSFLYGEEADAALGRLAVYPSGRAEFLPDGYVPPVGSIVKRPRLAATMRRLAAEGPDYFYKGEWAQHFVREVQGIGGMLSMDDLAAYKVRWEEPTRVSIKGGYELIGAPPPSTAGTLISMILNILEPYDLKAEAHYSVNAAGFNRIVRAFAFAESATDNFVKDPLSFDVPEQILLSKDYARMASAQIDASAPKSSARAAAEPGSGQQLAADFREKDPHSTDTDHIVAVDAKGNMVSVTHSVDGTTFGTGLVVDGVVLNSGNGFPGTATGPGRRTISPFDPTMLAKDGKPFMTIGSPGLASRAVAITLINYLYYGKSLEAAVDAPRFQGSDPSRATAIEARVSDTTREELKTAYGWQVRPTTPYNWHLGSVHAIAREPDGSLIGVADPRRTGLAAGY